MELSDDILFFLKNQNFVIVSTLDSDGRIHCSAKGLVEVYKDGRVFLIDLYHNKTYANIKKNPIVSLTQVDEHSFSGYTLQGKAKIVDKEQIDDGHLKKWEQRVLKRITARLIKSVRKERSFSKHHEVELPEEPKYLIEVDVGNVVALAPPCLKENKNEGY